MWGRVKSAWRAVPEPNRTVLKHTILKATSSNSGCIIPHRGTTAHKTHGGSPKHHFVTQVFIAPFVPPWSVIPAVRPSSVQPSIVQPWIVQPWIVQPSRQALLKYLNAVASFYVSHNSTLMHVIMIATTLGFPIQPDTSAAHSFTLRHIASLKLPLCCPDFLAGPIPSRVPPGHATALSGCLTDQSRPVPRPRASAHCRITRRYGLIITLAAGRPRVTSG